MKRTRHVYVIGATAFVPHPTKRGCWLKTDSSVFLTACTYCGARKGKLCRGHGPGGVTGGTHSARRAAAARIRQRLRRVSPPKMLVHHALR